MVSNPAKVGSDAGELAFIEPLGVAATDDVSVAFADDVDAVVYTATADTRPDEAFVDLIACLEAGANVVSTSFYPLLHPASAPPPMIEAVERACAEGDTSVFVSGIDPGWALDILPDAGERRECRASRRSASRRSSTTRSTTRPTSCAT